MMTTKTKESLGIMFNIANEVRLAYLRVKHQGQGVECTCCGSQFKSFASFGVPRRPNAWCPKCESLERHRLLWKFLEEKTNFYTSKLKILHVAPETVFFKFIKKMKNIDYYPADKFPAVYPNGTHYIDLLEIDFPENSFDAIICNHVFQYIENDRKAISEIYRVLKPGGWAILQVPINKKLKVTYEDPTITDPIEREKAFGLKEHVRFYGLDYADRLREAGFNVSVIDYCEEFTEEEVKRFGFWKGDGIYFVSKHYEKNVK
ncbi:MAG: class I SAM-dependent methyltransferase [Flavisolibacter sp.]